MGKYLPSIDYIGKVPCLNVFYPFFRRETRLIHCHNIFIIIIFDGFQGRIFASDYLFVDKHIATLAETFYFMNQKGLFEVRNLVFR